MENPPTPIKTNSDPSVSLENSEPSVVKPTPPPQHWMLNVTSITWRQGILISVLLTLIHVALILGIGVARGWNCHPETGELSFFTIRDANRFLPKPNFSNPEDQLIPERKGPFAAVNHYYWQLKPDLYSSGGIALVWILYILHQVSSWALTFAFQQSKIKYSNKLRNLNLFAMFVNYFFCMLHLGKTHWTYDGLAAVVAESSSQGGVILLLSGIILMEYPRRGVFFGRGDSESKYTLPPKPIELFSKYHGYFFSYAVIFDFWYHPAEPTAIFALGFAHTTLLMMQSSLAYTLAHKNVYWRFVLEIWVWIHGTVTALAGQQGNLWRMFFFGFLAVIVITQIHGLPFFMRHSNNMFVYLFPFVCWLSSVLAVYGSANDWPGLNEVIRIPLFLYGFCYLLWITNWCALRLFARCPKWINNRWSQLLGFFIVYVIIVLINVAFKAMHVQMDLLIMAAVLIAIYCVLAPIGALFIRSALRRPVNSN